MGNLSAMQIETLDHVALWVEDRDKLANFLTAHVGMHVIDRTDKFTLVGADARRGKLTLFAAEGERDPGVLARVGLRVFDLDEALAALPAGHPVEREDGTAELDAPGGLRLALVEVDEGVVLRPRPRCLPRPRPRGRPSPASPSSASTSRMEACAPATPGSCSSPATPARASGPCTTTSGCASSRPTTTSRRPSAAGIEIADVVDAANTYAVFVWGPERIKLEYVEHKPTFSLT